MALKTLEKQTDLESELPYYLVTTGLGRQSKAHIPKNENESLCGYGGEIMKKVDAEVVEKFREKCSKCQRIMKQNN